MPQSLAGVHVHLTFSAKDRRRLLNDRGLRCELHAYLAAISGELDCPNLIVGGVEDHVHVLSRLGRNISMADWVKELKRISSTWLNKRREIGEHFAWQSGYACFSVSASNIDQVSRYIANQEVHHRKVSFQEELRVLLSKHGLTWDEQYVWG